MKAKDLGWKAAIIEVLKSSKEPCHYVEITEEIIKKKLVKFDGVTPARTVSFYLTTEINKNGSDSIFERTGRGYYRLREGASDAQIIKEISEKETIKAVEETDVESGPIKSLGMFWIRNNVDWKGNPSILGNQFKDSGQIDFRDQIGIYVLHDGREIVYVGQAIDRPIGQRLFEHCSDRLNGRWDRFSWFGFYSIQQNGALEKNMSKKYDIEQCIDAFEAILIECSEPPLNRKRGLDFGGIEYLQVKDPKIKKKEYAAVLESLKEKME